MKFDKETILKHHFWLLLALALPLTLVAILILLTVVGAEISGNRKKLEDKLKEVSIAGSLLKNQRWVDVQKQAADEKKKREEEVWSKAYNVQKFLFTWPEAFEKKYHFQEGLFPTEIKAYRKAPPAGNPVMENKFRGRIQYVDEEWIIVVSDKKAVRKFFRTPQVTLKESKKVILVDENNKALNFFNLQANDFVEVTFEKGKYFGDALTDTEQTYYAGNYAGQIDAILAQADPVTAKGTGVVQLRGWTYQKGDLPPEGSRFFRFVAKDWNIKKNISEEAWIAQEDLWVQRELYRLVRLANKYVSDFQGKGGEDFGRAYTFTNPYWKMDLKLAGPKKLQITLTNLLPSRQKLDISFRVRLHKSAGQEAEKILIGGREPLNPQESFPLSVDLKGLPPSGIYGVQQVIDWETAAVKRIDHISIGSDASEDCCHSHRTFTPGLPYKEEKKASKAEAQPGPGGLGTGGPAGSGGAGGPGPGGAGRPGGPGKGQERGVTPNGLTRDRYLEVTKEARRIPVGIALIVDQDHVDRVLFAFANSPLRFLTTQVIMNRYPRSLRPSLNQLAGPGPGVPQERNPMPMPGGGGQPVPAPGFSQEKNPMPMGSVFPGNLGFPRMGGPNPGGPSSGAGNRIFSGDEQETNMELVIYGIVSLYERYPPRGAAALGP